MYDRPDYSKYTLDELYDVHNVVDRNKYPDNFQAIVNEIEKRKAEISTKEKDESIKLKHSISEPSRVVHKTPEDKLSSTLNKINKIYLILICLGLLYVIYTASGISVKFGHKESVQGLFGLILNSVTFLGIKFRKRWVVPYVLIISAFSFIALLITILRPADQLSILIGKLSGVFLLFFYAYQIRFFSKREVKKLFEAQGVELFNI